jgi:membrane protein YdbS with pleckstrin-like domain
MDVPRPARPFEEASEGPAVHESVADGVTRPLDPRIIHLDRIGGFIVTTCIAVASAIAILITWIAADTWWIPILLSILWVVVTGGLIWLSYGWPPIDYRHQSYCVDERGIEIRHGVIWRSVENVPRSRVQHIDVSQGPLERRFGLGKLSIYTAGTDYALVALRGLSHERALRIRNHLLPGESQDAV